MSVILCMLGVAITAAIFYAFFKKFFEVFGGLIVLGFGLLAYFLIKNLSITWPLAILGCGLLASGIAFPFLLIGDINDLEKELKKMSLQGKVSGEATDIINKLERVLSLTTKGEKKATPESTDMDTRKPWNEKMKSEIIDALKSSNLIEKEWAMEELQFYAQQGNVEARDILKSL
jgi:hypothetical protein